MQLIPSMNTSSQPRSSFAMAIAARAKYESGVLASLAGDERAAELMIIDAKEQAYACGVRAFADNSAIADTLRESAMLAHCWASGFRAASARGPLAHAA